MCLLCSSEKPVTGRQCDRPGKLFVPIAVAVHQVGTDMQVELQQLCQHCLGVEFVTFPVVCAAFRKVS